MYFLHNLRTKYKGMYLTCLSKPVVVNITHNEVITLRILLYRYSHWNNPIITDVSPYAVSYIARLTTIINEECKRYEKHCELLYDINREIHRRYFVKHIWEDIIQYVWHPRRYEFWKHYDTE